MKKLFITFLVSFMSLSANAQTNFLCDLLNEKGERNIVGGVNLNGKLKIENNVATLTYYKVEDGEMIGEVDISEYKRRLKGQVQLNVKQLSIKENLVLVTGPELRGEIRIKLNAFIIKDNAKLFIRDIRTNKAILKKAYCYPR